jgi:hypothetical protein
VTSGVDRSAEAGDDEAGGQAHVAVVATEDAGRGQHRSGGSRLVCGDGVVVAGNMDNSRAAGGEGVENGAVQAGGVWIRLRRRIDWAPTDVDKVAKAENDVREVVMTMQELKDILDQPQPRVDICDSEDVEALHELRVLRMLRGCEGHVGKKTAGPESST